MVTAGNGSRVRSAACGPALLSIACVALCLAVFAGDYQWRWAEDSSTRSFLLRGKELPLLGFSSMRSGWTIVQQQGPQLLDTAEADSPPDVASPDRGSEAEDSERARQAAEKEQQEAAEKADTAALEGRSKAEAAEKEKQAAAAQAEKAASNARAQRERQAAEKQQQEAAAQAEKAASEARARREAEAAEKEKQEAAASVEKAASVARARREAEAAEKERQAAAASAEKAAEQVKREAAAQAEKAASDARARKVAEERRQAEKLRREAAAKAEADRKASADEKWSSLEAHDTWTADPERDPAQYYVLRNVLVRDGNIVLFAPPAADGSKLPNSPGTYYFFRPGKGAFVNINYEATPLGGKDPFAACTAWVREPAMLFYIWTFFNIYHFLADGLGSIFVTLSELGLLPDTVTRVLDQKGQTPGNCTLDTPSPGVLLFAKDEVQLRDQRAFLLDGLGLKRPWAEMEGKCLETLVVGTSRVLDFTYTPRDARELQRRTDILADYRHYMFRAALAEDIGDMTSAQATSRQVLVEDECGGDGSGSGQPTKRRRWRCECGRPRVTLASRPAGFRRAFINEREVKDFIRHRYDVDFVSTNFSMSTWEAFALLRSTDVFMGIHGAAFANLLAMHQDTTEIQLFPYGWQLPDGSIMREAFYRGMAVATNASYYRWMNENPHHAYFRRQDFIDWGNESAWREHPDPNDDLPRPVDWRPPQIWTYQDTYVDLTTFGPVLEEAFAAAGIQPRKT